MCHRIEARQNRPNDFVFWGWMTVACHFSAIFLHPQFLNFNIFQALKLVNSITSICRNKIPTRCNRWFLLQILLLAQHVLGTIMPIIWSSRVLYRWLLPVVFGALVFKLSVWCGAEGYMSGLQAAATARKLDTWYLVLWFSSCQFGVEWRVMCPVCGLLQQLDKGPYPIRKW